jgi:hypothetical protein
MTPPAVNCPADGCGIVQAAVMHQRDQDRRLDGHDQQIQELHGRITDGLKSQVGDSKTWILFLISLVVQVVALVWKH